MLPENVAVYKKAKESCPEHYELDFVGQLPDRNKNYIAIYAPKDSEPSVKEYAKKYVCARIDENASGMMPPDDYKCKKYRAYIWNSHGSEKENPVINVKITRGSGVYYTLSENYKIRRGQITQAATFGRNPPYPDASSSLFDPTSDVYPIFIRGLHMTRPKPAYFKPEVVDLMDV